MADGPLTQHDQPRLGWLPALVGVVLTCGLVSAIGWLPLSVPPRLLALVIPRQIHCNGLELGTPAMYVCNSRIAFLTLLSPLVFTVILFLFRRQVAGWLRATLIPRVPAGWRFLAAPLIATAVFAISWSYLHSQTWLKVGILPEILFPVAIGVFTFVTTQYGAGVRRGLRPYIVRRDTIPRPLRFVIAFVLPTVVAIALARSLGSNVDLSSQLIVLVSLALAYLILVPAEGSLAQSVRKVLGTG